VTSAVYFDSELGQTGIDALWSFPNLFGNISLSINYATILSATAPNCAIPHTTSYLKGTGSFIPGFPNYLDTSLDESQYFSLNASYEICSKNWTASGTCDILLSYYAPFYFYFIPISICIFVYTQI
jgi:hypothetical protein